MIIWNNSSPVFALLDNPQIIITVITHKNKNKANNQFNINNLDIKWVLKCDLALPAV